MGVEERPRDPRMGEQGSAQAGHKAGELFRLVEVGRVVVSGELHGAESVLKVVRGAVVNVNHDLCLGVVSDGEFDIVLDNLVDL